MTNATLACAPEASSLTADSSRPIRVVHAVISLAPGGLERQVLNLVLASGNFSQPAHVICMQERGDLAQAAPQQITCLEKSKGGFFRTLIQMRRTLRRIGCDVLHTHQIGPLVYGGLAAKALPHVVVVHTQHGRFQQSSLRQRLFRNIASHCVDKFCCVSSDIRDQVSSMRMVSESKLAVVSNGIDVDRFSSLPDSGCIRDSLGIPADALVIGTVGRLAKVKRHDRLLKAFFDVRSKLPQLHLLIVGDGPQRSSLENLADQLGLASHTHFVGFQEEVAPYLAAMNVFVQTSETEGMPIAILEAWASNCPVVATRVGGVPELIDDGKTGLLCEFGDHPSLVRAIDRLLHDPDLTAALTSAACQQVAERYGIQSVLRSYHSHYLPLLQRKTNRSFDASGRS